jgi:hypothetical protein
VQFVGIWNLEVRAKPYGSGDSIPPSPFGWVDRAVLLTAGRLGGKAGGKCRAGPRGGSPRRAGRPGPEPHARAMGRAGLARLVGSLAARDNPEASPPRVAPRCGAGNGARRPRAASLGALAPRWARTSAPRPVSTRSAVFWPPRAREPYSQPLAPPWTPGAACPGAPGHRPNHARRCPGRWPRRSSIMRHPPARVGWGLTEK